MRKRKLARMNMTTGLIFSCLVGLTFSTASKDFNKHDFKSFTGYTSPSPHTGYACEGSTLELKCDPESEIRIVRANYGRLNIEICNEKRITENWDTRCMSMRALRIVSELCDRTPGPCSLLATNRNFGDPCNNTPKYLEVQYICKPANKSAVRSKKPTIPTTVLTTSSTTSTAPSTEASLQNVISTSTFPTSYLLHSIMPTTVPTNTSSKLTDSVYTYTLATKSPSSPTNEGTNPAQDTDELNFPSSDPAQDASGPNFVSSDSYHDPLPIDVEFCEPVNARNVIWPIAVAGETVYMDCPNNQAVKKATWKCGADPVGWVGHPDLSECISEDVQRIHRALDESQNNFSVTSLDVVVDDLMNFTDSVEEIIGGDMAFLVETMQEMVDQVDVHMHDISAEEMSYLSHRVKGAVLETSSNFLDMEQMDSWNDLPSPMQSEAATRMVSNIERSAFHAVKNIEKPQVVVDVKINIVIELRVIDVRERIEDLVFPQLDPSEKKSDWQGCGNSITLDGDAVRELGVDGLAKVLFATYNNLEQLLKPQHDQAGDASTTEVPVRPGTTRSLYNQKGKASIETENTELPETDQKVASKIISAVINERTEDEVPLSEPVLYTLQHVSDENYYNPTCSFWEYSEKSMNGKWSNFGCQLVSTNTTHTTCSCEHLTNFAILMSVTNNKHLDGVHSFADVEVHNFALSFITYFGCVVSIVCLFLAFLTFNFVKNLQCDRNTVHKNLSACLCVAEIVFLGGIAPYSHPVVCSVVAIVLHYLFLTSFMWMLLEGVQLYIMLVEVFEAEKSKTIWYYVAGYGTPAIIVAISAAVNFSGYGTPDYCWLSTENGFIWAFVGPVCFIICVNIVMLTIAMYVMCRHASSASANWKMKEKGDFEKISSWIKGAVVLIVLLGLTWLFGIFYVGRGSIVMAYIFTVLNTLQGTFIFIFHCLLNEKVMKEYKKWFEHKSWLPSNLQIRRPGKASFSITPQNSSSGPNHLTKLLLKRKRSSLTSLPTSSSPTKCRYNQILRNSSGRESVAVDSGIHCNDDSHIYSEVTEDPNAYLEPTKIRLEPDEDIYCGDMSIMEGSVADTEYMDNFTQRGNSNGINVNKYKLRPLDAFGNRLPEMPISESNESFPDSSVILPRKLGTGAFGSSQGSNSDESLVQKKLDALGGSISSRDSIEDDDLNRDVPIDGYSQDATLPLRSLLLQSYQQSRSADF